MLLFAGCTDKTYTPYLKSEYSLDAVYKTGDFSYDCKIYISESCVCVTPLSTNAKGMTIKYDGKNVTFTKGAFTKSFPRESIDSVNPAIVIYEVFGAVKNNPDISAKVKNDSFCYVGTISVGSFTFLQSKSDLLKSITVPDAKIEITFKS